MKLPEDKKQRTQVLALIGIGVILVLVGLFYGIGFIRDQKKATADKTKKLKEDIRKANLEIDQMSKDRKDNTETLQKMKDLSDKYLLKQRIGNNYFLSAKEILETEAQKVNLLTPTAMLGISEIGLSDISPASGKVVPPVRAYTAHVSIVCGYNDLVRFIRTIEDDNPLVSVMNITIVARSPPNVETHAAAFDVQWPVWTDQEMPSKLEAQIAAQGGGQEKR
jgi:hypothetical protein